MTIHNLLIKCLTFLTLVLCQLASAQNTAIPDPNFEQALIDQSLDDVLDGHVLTANINTIESINVDNRSISNLTGIQAFDSLSFLSCKQNALATLDVSQNSKLVMLDCRLNVLTEIDVSQNSLLQTLRCANNSISMIDVSQNPVFRILNCSDNPLTGLDVSANPELFWLYCDNSGLASLDVTQNPLLGIVHCSGNALSSLDLSQNVDLHTLDASANQLVSIDFGATSSMSILQCENNLLTELETGFMIMLETLNCDDNQIAQLDLVSSCLQVVSCNNNQMENLDMSQSTTMTAVFCSNNPPLQSIDLRNSNASSIGTLIAQVNPNLTCIYVDDATFDHGSNWQFNTVATVIVETEAECMLFVGIPEHQQDERSAIYPNPSNGYFSINTKERIEGITIYNIGGQEIQVLQYQDLYSLELPTGVYLIKLEYEQNYEIKKLVVE